MIYTVLEDVETETSGCSTRALEQKNRKEQRLTKTIPNDGENKGTSLGTKKSSHNGMGLIK